MKKLISVMLLLAMVLGLFAGCGKEQEATDLQNAIEYLTSMYQTAGKDEAILITADLDVLSSVVVDGTSYDVTWDVAVTEGAAESVTIGESTKENHVKLDIPLHSGENILFTATATVFDAEENSESVAFNYMVEGTVLAGAGMTMEELVEAAYGLDEDQALEGLAILTGVVTMINTPYDAGYQNLTCTMVVGDLTDMPIKCYRLKGEGAETLNVGDTVTVSGTLKNYGGTIEFDAGCMIDELIKSTEPAPEAPADPAQIIQDAYALGENESLTYTATLTGVITSVDTPFDAGYQNVTVTIAVPGSEDMPIKCYRLKGEGADTIAVGDTITVTGVLMNYAGTVEFAQGCSLDEIVSGGNGGASTQAPIDPVQIVDEAYALAPEASLPYVAVLTGTVLSVDTPFDATYQNVTVTMAVTGRDSKPIKCFRLKGNGADQLAVGDSITVSGVIKNFGGTIEYDAGCTLTAFIKGNSGNTNVTKPATEVEVVDQAYKLQREEKLPYVATLTGKVSAVTESYNTQYQNVTVTIQVPGRENMPITCFRMKGTDADKVAVDDTITVTGTIKNFNGIIEFDAGCTLDSRTPGAAPVVPETDPAKILAAAYALEKDQDLGYDVTLTGKISAVQDVFDPEFRNVSVVIKVEGCEDKPLLCYRLKGENADKLAVNDTITVVGRPKNYNGTIELVSGILIGYVSGGGSAVTVETDPLKIIDMAYALQKEEQLPYDVTLTGRVSKVQDAYNAEYQNITVEMLVTGRESKPILCYRLKGTGVDQVAVNDTITVKGRLKKFNETVEFDFGCELLERKSGGGTAVKQETEPAAIMAAAKQLAENTEMSYDVTLSGKVTSVDEAYNAEYQNVTVTITVDNANNESLKCYRMKGEGVDAVAAGDTITVTGRIKNHYGTLELVYGEMTQRTSGGGTAPEAQTDPLKIVDEAYALEQGASLAYSAELTGTIVELQSPYDAQYKNMTVAIVVSGREDKPIVCYRMKGDAISNDLCVGDSITVTGRIKNYNGTVEFDAGCQMTARTPGSASKPSDSKLIVDAAFALAENQSLPYFATLTGVVKSIDEPYTDQYKNVTLTMTVEGSDGSKDLICYRMKGEGADTLKAGDTITVTGAIKRFVRDTDEGVHEDKIEFDSGCTFVKG